MNKELIRKYKAEFDHWLNGGNIQVCHKKDDEPKWWTDQECVDFSSVDNFSYLIRSALSPDDVLVIIDDEYIEFRKAGAEGKQLQVSYNDGKTWFDKSYRKISWSKSQLVRIKPEEPKFKVDDWLIEIHSNSYAKVLEVFTQEVRVKLYDCNSIITTENTDFKLWKPQLGKWCWFSNDRSYDTPCLRKFITIIDDTYIALNSQNSSHITPTEVPSFERGISDSYVRYKNCEPFIGQLPTILKE